MRSIYLFSILIFAAIFIAGCVTGEKMQNEVQLERQRLDVDKKRGAKLCASYSLAIAESELQFAEEELDAGNYIAAEEHMSNEKTFAAESSKNADKCFSKEPVKPKEVVREVVKEIFKPDCEEAAERELPLSCGLNLKGNQPQLCIKGRWVNNGACKDTSICKNEATNLIPNSCGLNLKGSQPQACTNGQWMDSGVCQDPDVCKNAEVQTAPCGIDGKGTQPQVCTNGQWVNNGECAELDTDKDGIPDSADKCPNEPGVKEENGCPKKYKLIVVTAQKIELKQTVFFKTAQGVIEKKSYPMLKEVADAIKTISGIKVTIEGHTDNVGNRAYNVKLSQTRADSVKEFLIDEGVEAAKLEAIGYGPDKPISSNKTETGRAKNRRVEFKIAQ